MPQYTTGTARALSAAPQRIELVGGVTSQITPGDLFKFQADVAPNWHTVGSIVSGTIFDLTGPYTGQQAFDTLLPFVIVRDFTTNLRLPELWPGDIAIRDVYTHAMRLIDALGRNLLAEFSFVGVTTVGDKPFRWYPPYPCKISGAAAMVGSAAAGSSCIVNVKKNGASIFATAGDYPTITAGQHLGVGGVPATQDLLVTDFLAVEVVQAGGTSDLVIQVRF
jgi:hypothetical protein